VEPNARREQLQTREITLKIFHNSAAEEPAGGAKDVAQGRKPIEVTRA